MTCPSERLQQYPVLSSILQIALDSVGSSRRDVSQTRMRKDGFLRLASLLKRETVTDERCLHSSLKVFGFSRDRLLSGLHAFDDGQAQGCFEQADCPADSYCDDGVCLLRGEGTRHDHREHPRNR